MKTKALGKNIPRRTIFPLNLACEILLKYIHSSQVRDYMLPGLPKASSLDSLHKCAYISTECSKSCMQKPLSPFAMHFVKFYYQSNSSWIVLALFIRI